MEDVQQNRLQRALVAIRDLRQRLGEAEARDTEPIAVVGMGCRFPGGADTPARFWQLLRQGVDAIGEIPAERWDVEAYYDPDPDAPGKIYSKSGGFLSTAEVETFDPAFFGISPREARAMDPQHRLVLEVAWEALERSGRPPETLRDRRVGFFLGLSQSDFDERIRGGDPRGIDRYCLSGGLPSFAAGRLAYLLGTHGPALVVDAACSSSLVTIHLACQSLRSRESDLALAGGVNVMLSPEGSVILARMKMLSMDGRCKPFDASADGYVRGEGCGMVVLKRLSDATADGDPILAVVRGSAVNHDGASSGLTVPNGLAQESLVREALAKAGVEPREVTYVEAHGTGTSLGDPIEVEALGAVFAGGRPPDRPLWIGSVKSNVGHLESGAGVAGVIKTVLALQHAEIPPSLHFEEPNPHILWDEVAVEVPTTVVPWPTGEGPRVAGVSSFGASGTNAHVVLSAAPASPTPRAREARSRELLVLSARSAGALDAVAGRYAEFLGSAEGSVGDVCYTAAVGRSAYTERLAVVGASRSELSDRLASFGSGTSVGGVSRGSVRSGVSPRVVFLFSGQGSQYAGMGRELYETEGVFRRELERCDTQLVSESGWSLLELLYGAEGDGGRLRQTQYTQPALFALGWSLAALWRSWGVEPSVVLGHSVGEYTAASVSGALELEDGLRLIAARGRLMGDLPSGGAMAAVFAEEGWVLERLAGLESELSIAAVNGPGSVVVSGAEDALEVLLGSVGEQGVKSTRLAVSHAFHSPLMGPMLEELDGLASGLEFRSPRIRMVSNVRGEFVAGAELARAGYWRSHTRDPVRFGRSMELLEREGYHVFVELGPGTTLLGMGSRVRRGAGGVWLSSLRQGRSDRSEMLSSLGRLWVEGVEVDWEGHYAARDYRRVELPTYPFQRQRFWYAPEPVGPASFLDRLPDAEIVRRLERTDRLSAAELELAPKVLEELRRVAAQGAPTDIESGVYDLVWQPADDVPSSTPLPSFDHWLVFADRTGVGEAVARKLRNAGCHVVSLSSESTTELAPVSAAPGGPAEATDYRRLVEEVAEGSIGVVHLWNLEARAANETTSSSLVTDVECGVASVLAIVRSLARRGSSPDRIWVVTRGAVATGDEGELLSPSQSPVWGLGRAVSVERPGLWGGLIDLDPAARDHTGEAEILAEGDRVLAGIAAADGEDQIAHRHGVRLVPRLASRVPSGRRVDVRPDGVYLISGGLGALGLQTAEWLAARGARDLLLVGRTGVVGEIARETLQRLESRGVRVTTAGVDVADREAVREVLSGLGPDRPLRAVVHAAGVTAFEEVEAIDAARLHDVLYPKVQGTWVLHEATRGMDLDWFLSYSSATSVLGAESQAHYAAANHFLDTFAHYRSAIGGRTRSVNWGPWEGGGMATREYLDWLGARGLEPLQPDRAFPSLDSLLAGDSRQLVVADIEWSLFRKGYGARRHRPLLERLRLPASGTGFAPDAGTAIRDQLADGSPEERRERLWRWLRQESALLLGLGSGADLDPETPLAESGFDSLMAVQLRNTVEESLGLEISVRTILEEATARAICDRLFDLVPSSVVVEMADGLGIGEESDPVPSDPAGSRLGATRARELLGRVEELSGAEVDSLLDEMLKD